MPGFNTLDQIQLVAACISERDRQAWLDFKANTLHATSVGVDYVPKQKVDIEGKDIAPPTEFGDLQAPPKPPEPPGALLIDALGPSGGHLGTVGFNPNF
jgi:hypothetical protein